MRHGLILLAILCIVISGTAADEISRQKAEAQIPAHMLGKWPNADKAIQSKTDYWGEMAMKQPNGPSYEYFAKLLPPLRYVDARFHHYPIVLSAPSAVVKSRLISNGSAVNALARQRNWIGEGGMPVNFFVSRYEVPFGDDLRRLSGPRYEKGYLPIVRTQYKYDDAVISEEAFGAAEGPFADSGAVFVKFSGKGKLAALVTQTAGTNLRTGKGVIRDEQGSAVMWFAGDWTPSVAGQKLDNELAPDRPAFLVIFTKPYVGVLPPMDSSVYDAERTKCACTWQALLDKGMQIETPEPVVNNAWRALLIGMYELVHGDQMRYSAGNQYAQLYISEGGDAIRTLGLFGQPQDMRRMMNPLMDYQRTGLWYNQAGKKLYFMSHYYQLTRGASWFKENRDRWMLQVNRLVDDREPGNGLLPKERYCGDIETPVYALNVNANAYGSLRDFAAVLEEIGEHEQSLRCAKASAELKKATLDAVAKSEFKDVNPPFLPNALFGEEKPYDPLTSVRLGGYWDLMAPYIIGSGLFTGTEREEWMMRYLQEMGGLCMGMVRTHPGSTFWTVKQNNDDLYTLRYTLALFRRDEVDRALVSFYGKLAQGLTQDTFIGAEGTGLMPYDDLGRQMYMPPNSASNAYWLWTLRYVMVQDWDLDNDGKPETLRLMFATPRRWLESGKTIKIERAPTAFGNVSVAMTSHLKKGEVVAEVSAPERAPEKMLLRARVPQGWKVVSAKAGNRKLAVDKTGAVDITGMTGKFSVAFGVSR